MTERSAGESTLLRGLVGVVRISTGTVSVGGRQITNLPQEEVARAGVGYVPQVDDIFAPLRRHLLGGTIPQIQRGSSPWRAIFRNLGC